MKNSLYRRKSRIACVFYFFHGKVWLPHRKGMQLWLNILLPTLLPFMILTGVLIRTDMRLASA